MSDNVDLEQYFHRIKLDDMKGKIVKHFKGDLYLVIDTNVTHTETEERMVLYKALYGDCKLYVRPANMFIERCSEEQYEKYHQAFRFELVDIKSKKI